MSRAQLYVSSAISMLTAFSLFGVVDGGNVSAKGAELPSIPGRILVKVDSNIPITALEMTAKDFGAKSVQSYEIVKGLHLYEFGEAADFESVKRAFLENPAVQYAEPDYLYSVQDTDTAIPNDPRFPEQWALRNTGQNQGSVGADINALAMWAIQTGSKNVVIATIDTGMDYTHPDLVQNVWTNPNEIPGNNIDDDHNGYVDDMHGINAITNSGNPMDDNLHGTHVAGTIGAVANNTVGVVGVAQSVTIAACKFLSAQGSGAISDAIKCMEYFAKLKSQAKNPINILATSNSWGGGAKSLSMQQAIEAHRDLGMLFIAAAGNESNNNDNNDRWPCNYDVSNVISVAATDKNDQLASFSNYGKTKVHVAAPGVKILSTVLNHGYALLSGTSMATPHVSGLAAIIASNDASLNYLSIKNLIMAGGQEISAVRNNTISGRRIRGADVNGIGSLTCLDQHLLSRMAPSTSANTLNLGSSLLLKALNINCASPAGPVTLAAGITLNDGGQNGDTTAGDGVYSLLWQPQTAGTYALHFSNTDVVNITVVDPNAAPKAYKAYDISYSYSPIGGTRLHATDDSLFLIRAPFAIPFAGEMPGYTDFVVGSNGTISFTDMSDPGYVNSRLPTSKAETLVAPFWDDLLYGTSSSDIYIDVLGSAPDRSVVVEWWRVQENGARGLGAFQTVFFENSSDILFNYLSTNFLNSRYDYGASATVGLQTSSEDAVQYSYNQASVPSNKSILFRLQ